MQLSQEEKTRKTRTLKSNVTWRKCTLCTGNQLITLVGVCSSLLEESRAAAP